MFHGRVILMFVWCQVVLKAINSNLVSAEEFYREYQNSFLLSTHKNVLCVYDTVFQAGGYFMFAMEYAPLGDLTSNTTDNGVGELYAKRVAIQIGSHPIHDTINMIT